MGITSRWLGRNEAGRRLRRLGALGGTGEEVQV
jgi:hypothetical protein